MGHYKKGLLFCAAVFIVVSHPVSGQVDETVRENTFGRDVTEAVIRRITASTIFPEDHSFLTRLAYVESKFGTSNTTFRDEYFGGIWQVEESVFRVTQTNHQTLAPLHLAIRNRFGVDWLKLKWSNLVVPLYSGLAAALYFARVGAIEPIPFRIAEQANHWKKWYRPLGEVDRFVEDSEDLRNQTRCRGKMDLAIVLDSSGSINQFDPRNYGRAKDFIAQMIESFTLDYNRIGMLVYSANYRDIFHINNTLRIDEMARLARNAVYLNAGTRTDLAIYRAVQMFQQTEIIEGVPRLVFVFTDGNSDRGSDLINAVRAARANSLKTVAVGIGNNIDQNELSLIAMDDDKSVFMLTDFESLQDFLFEITSVACETPQTPALNGTVSDTVVKDEKRLYAIELPDEGITVTVDVKEGQTNGYWSWTEKVPSAAIHDGKINGPTYIPPNPSANWAFDLRDEDETTRPTEPSASVFITIQGVAESNNYTLTSSPGLSDDVTTTEDPEEGETTTEETTTPTEETTTSTEQTTRSTSEETTKTSTEQTTTSTSEETTTTSTEQTTTTTSEETTETTTPEDEDDGGGAATIGLAKLTAITFVVVNLLFNKGFLNM